MNDFEGRALCSEIQHHLAEAQRKLEALAAALPVNAEPLPPQMQSQPKPIVTFDNILETAKSMLKDPDGKEEFKALLAKFNLTKLTDLSPSQYYQFSLEMGAWFSIPF